MPRLSAATFIKALTGFDFVTDEELSHKDNYSTPTDPDTGKEQGKPNSAVLNYSNGVVLENQAGKELVLEGFADAYNEPISKIEYSLDHGETWTTLETPGNDPTRWTYWRLALTPEAGNYLLKIRTTSLMADGTERVCSRDTSFLFYVK